MREATEILHKNYPGMLVDGEMQANFALNNELLKEQFPFSDLVDKKINTLIGALHEDLQLDYMNELEKII